MSYIKSSRAVQVHYCAGEISGLREIESLGSIVQVRAGPWSERDILKKTAPFFTYALAVGPKAYFGSATHDRAIGDRLGAECERVDQIYIIYSHLPCFDRAMADKVEARLIELAVEAGLPVLNKCLPFGRDGLTANPAFEELMIDVLFMLAAAGFGHFEKHSGSNTRHSRLSPVNTLINSVHYIEPEDWVVPDGAQPVCLVHRELRAQAFMTGHRRILVAPGADWCLISKSGLSTGNRKRREDIEAAGHIEPTGDSARGRLRIGLECTPAIAAKLISGEHVDSDVWQPVVNPVTTVQSDHQTKAVATSG